MNNILLIRGVSAKVLHSIVIVIIHAEEEKTSFFFSLRTTYLYIVLAYGGVMNQERKWVRMSAMMALTQK